MSGTYVEDYFINHIVALVQENGPLPITTLGQLLNKRLGSSAGVVIKKEFKGLKNLLAKHKDMFRIRGKIPQLILDLNQTYLDSKLNKENSYTSDLANPLPAASNPPPSAAPPPSSHTDGSEGSSAPVNRDPLEEYLRSFGAIVRADSINSLSALLKVADSPRATELGEIVASSSTKESLDAHIEEKIESYINHHFWNQIVLRHLLVCANYVNKNYRATVSSQISLFTFYQNKLREGDSLNFSLPIWSVLILDLRKLSLWSDRSMQAAGQPTESCLNLATAALNESLCFVSGRAPAQRQLGALAVTNALFRIYFHLNTTKLCDTVVDTINRLPSLETYPVSHYVTCKFFRGKYRLYSGNYVQASNDLTSAFEKCSRKYMKNRRVILTYLVPVKLLLGSFPTRETLQKYDLMQFLNISLAVKSGNLREFEKAIEENEKFIERGIYLVLRRVIVILYRNLLKKVYLLSNKNEKILISTFQAALQWQGMDLDLDEAQCIIANLIAEKYIRGYISQKARTLVLSTTNAFVKNWAQ